MAINKTRYIFVTGGVLSSLGKGATASALGAILVARGLKVTLQKIDPYFNLDPGTMNPREHGEVFVTHDGKESDLDLGHYERFTGAVMRKENSFSAGTVYDKVLRNEREGKYLGKTVQIIPHITDEIKRRIQLVAKDYDIALIEIGGTVGDIESLPFLEAIRQLIQDLGRRLTLTIHLTWIPYLHHTQESKSKPTQHSVKEMLSIGLQPDVLICRSERKLASEVLEKISLHTSVARSGVIPLENIENEYEMPLLLHARGLDKEVIDLLQLRQFCSIAKLGKWKKIVKIEKNHPSSKVRVALVGKYGKAKDTYKSLVEALRHAAIQCSCLVQIDYVNSAKIEKGDKDTLKQLSDANAILIPGGFGTDGIEGKIKSAGYARKSGKPFLGICLGMQVAVIEYARSELNLADANSSEFKKKAKHPVVALVTEWLDEDGKLEKRNHKSNFGGTMRLGAEGFSCALASKTKIREIYKSGTIYERHRHRYEINGKYRKQLEEGGLVISGTSKDSLQLIEVVELKKEVHPWFIGCQFHPEFTSSPLLGHPLFNNFLRAGLEFKKNLSSRD